jgi:hypothetical protein
MPFHFTDSQIIRFWSRVDTSDHWGCWPWMGSRTKFGHGQVTLALKRCHAHRLAYELVYGEIPDGLVVSHACNNAPCCNPTHLKAVTQSENVRYMYLSGRAYSQGQHYSKLRPEALSRGDAHYSRQHPERLARGERNGAATLTADKVREIRRMFADGVTQTEIGRRLGVAQTNVSLIVRGKRWAHVT